MHLERPDRANWSSIKHLLVSPRLYLHRLANPPADTEALQLGRVLHALVYEPDTFDARYIVSPRFHAGQNDETAIRNGYDGGKQAKAAWAEQVGAREPIDADLMRRARAMTAALRADPVASSLIVGGRAEQAIEWIDPVTGIECRARTDYVCPDGAGVVLSDLKSSRALASFERDVARFGYHGQMAFYADGLAALGHTLAAPPCLIVVESEAPWDTAVFDVSEDVLACGRALYRRALDRLHECRMTGAWPGFVAEGRRTISLPAWANVVEDSLPEPTGEQDII